MSDEEFEVMDELYFVTSYDDLEENCDCEKEQLISVLSSLHEKGWIRVLSGMDEEISVEKVDLPVNYASYFYLASKKGLLAHNSK